jgi:predicted nuclease with TOPRIM domain
MIKIKSLFERLQEQELLLEQQEDYLIGKIEELKDLNKEYGKLKNSHIFLIGKHENLEKKYARTTNVSSCVDSLEKENANLKAQLEVLTSKHVKMQKDYEMLKCSHEDVQDAHIMLQVSHEVVVTSVKHFQPHTQEYTCSPNFINSICANAYCSQSPQSNVEQINVDSCDDLIAKENDTLKLEVRRLEQKVKCWRSKLK